MIYHVFDFDGVILNSASIKENEFFNLYKDSKYDDDFFKIKSYLELNPGVPRKVKISHIEKNILKSKDSNFNISEKLKSFSTNVYDKVLASEFIIGVENYLTKLYKDPNCLLFVSSATPDKELVSIINNRNLNHYFEKVYGSDISKQSALREIIFKYKTNESNVVFYGDSPNDYIASVDVNVNFIGVGKVLKNNDIRIIKNFNELL